ncbi:MAG TPA: XRE family transcriptional regulator [Ruminococcaceae bacterium]|nr:XRE family transcriptional regulator [Oscillospiraceae bacterium]
MPKLCEKLIQLKTERNLLQKDIAEGSGLLLRTYQRYEYGERLPDTDALIKLCIYFDVSADYLLGLSSDPTRR